MGSDMKIELDNDVVYVLNGISQDVETIVRLRPWIEDEVRDRHGDFSRTKLYTDYNPKNETFQYKIVFYK
jgi:hypothetical protein